MCAQVGLSWTKRLSFREFAVACTFSKKYAFTAPTVTAFRDRYPGPTSDPDPKTARLSHVQCKKGAPKPRARQLHRGLTYTPARDPAEPGWAGPRLAALFALLVWFFGFTGDREGALGPFAHFVLGLRIAVPGIASSSSAWACPCPHT